MKQNYKYWTLSLLLGIMAFPGDVFAQDFTVCPADEAECVVEWEVPAEPRSFEAIPNALRNTVLNDTLNGERKRADRIYVLKRGGFYHNTDPISANGFHLYLLGQTADEADPADNVCGDGTEDCGPAIIQRITNIDGNAPGQLIVNSGSNTDVTLRNIWLMGQDNTGNSSAYEPIQLDANNSIYTIDNVIFDQSDWHFLGPNSDGISMYVTNSRFRNNHGPTQQWEGIGVRFENGADTVVFENNTFFNTGFTPFQSEALPIEYFRANHNTFVNIGRNFSAGALWKEAYITNNVFINPFWHGEQPSEYNNPDRETEYTGFFSIADLPSDFGTNDGRRIYFAKNTHWMDPTFKTYGADSIRVQPLIADSSMYFVNTYETIKVQENFINDGASPYPAISTYPDNLSEMTSYIVGIRNGVTTEYYRWDPGRDQDNFVLNVWPMPEDFSYTDASLQAAGTDQLPIGDLNWFPSAYETFKANKEAYVSAIEEAAGPRKVITVEGIAEAEDATIAGGEVTTVDGFTYWNMDNGTIEWTFNLESAGTYDLNVWTHMRNNGVRGQRIIVNGTSIKDTLNYGEYIWDAEGGQGGGVNPHVGMATDAWVWTRINNADLHSSTTNGLVLPAGENVIRIESSWGFQNFAGIDILPEGSGDDAAVVELRAPDAVTTLVTEGCGMEGEEADYCPSGFKLASLGESGGSTTFGFEVAEAGTYQLRVFGQINGSAQSLDITLGGATVATESASGADGESFDFVSSQFEIATTGTNMISVVSTGAVSIDYVQLLKITTIVSNENDPNGPEGFKLSQNYPNPFNPTTNINFTLPAASNATLTVYNLLGQKVATLIDGRMRAGAHTVQFNARNLASGVYFYQLQAGDFTLQRRMTLIK